MYMADALNIGSPYLCISLILQNPLILFVVEGRKRHASNCIMERSTCTELRADNGFGTMLQSECSPILVSALIRWPSPPPQEYCRTIPT